MKEIVNVLQLKYALYIFSCLRKTGMQSCKYISMNNTSTMNQDWLKNTRGLLKTLAYEHEAYVL
jgi:hypothetical protein